MKQVEQLSEAERVRLGLGDRGPIADLLRVLEEHAGMQIGLVQLGTDGVAGVYQVREEVPIILLNSSYHPVRQRFTLAHEYGHHCLEHGPALDAGIDLAPRDRREVDANRFAAELLLPRVGIEWWLQTHDDPALDLETLVRIAACYGVSSQVALYRLAACGRLRPSAQRALEQRIEGGEHRALARRLRLLELVDTLVRERHRPVRMPVAVARIVLRAYDAGLIDRRGAAERLHLPDAELPARAGDADFV